MIRNIKGFRAGRIEGQITVFASLVIVLVISVVCAAIQSVSVSVAKTNANVACNLSVESVFAQYSRPLLDEFDVLFFKKSDSLQYHLKSYIEKNTNCNTGFTSEKLQSVEINEICMATDNGGNAIRQEVLDYMKYGMFSEAVQMLMNSEEELKKAEKTKEIVDSIAECENGTSEIDSIILQLVTAIEGVASNENGFEIKDNSPVLAAESFVKKACVGTVSPENVFVSDDRIYGLLSSEYVNYLDLLTNMKLNAENFRLSLFSDNYNEFKSVLEDTIGCTQKAIEIAEQYDGATKKLSDTAQEIQGKVESNRILLGDEQTDDFLQDLKEFQNSNENKAQSMCDVNSILSALKTNLGILNNTKQIFDSMNSQLNKENAEQEITKIESCVDAISKLDNSKLQFDYSEVRFDSASKGLSGVKKIIKTFKEGIMGLVVEDTSKISQKTISYNDLASSQQNGSYEYWKNMTGEAKDNALYNEYLFLKFKSYTDSFDSEGKVVETKALLEYSVEYILFGKNSDEENLKSAIIQLTFIRQGVNMAHIFTDSEKKNQSLALAASLLGFTGIHAVIKAGQYLIMTAWAYGEAIMDVRKLCAGKKVEMVKNRNNWQLSLENLLAMNFASDRPDSEKGFTYEEYLRMLFFREEPGEKYFRTMDAMELRMIELGYNDFRMKDYVYSLNADAVFLINGNSIHYSQDIQYEY